MYRHVSEPGGRGRLWGKHWSSDHCQCDVTSYRTVYLCVVWSPAFNSFFFFFLRVYWKQWIRNPARNQKRLLISVRFASFLIFFPWLDRGQYFRRNVSANGRTLISGHCVSPNPFWDGMKNLVSKWFFLFYFVYLHSVAISKILFETRKSISRKAVRS